MQIRLKNEICDILRREFKAGRRLTTFDAELICGIDSRNAREYVKALHGSKEIHISTWRRDAKVGPWTPVYAWLHGEDAAKPKRLKRVFVRE